MNRKLEEDGESLTGLSCWQRSKRNFGKIKEGLKYKELSGSLIFFFLQGAVVPRYDDYMYFYITSEKYANMSKFTYGILRLVSHFGSLIGVFAYSYFCKNTSIKIMMVIASFINFIAAIGQLMFLKGIFLGMNPAVFYGIVELVSDAFAIAFVSMPSLALVAKLIPHNIESALFAFFTGLAVLNYYFVAKILGNLINEFFF